MTRRDDGAEVLGEGRFLRLVRRDGWEHVERTNITGIVVIVAATDDGHMVLNEQFRKPVRQSVIEIPAGLAGDVPGTEHDSLEQAARRELLEETGFEAEQMDFLFEGPPSAGMSTEVLTFFRARGLRRVGPGGGDGHENIRVHLVPLADVEAWIARRVAEGCTVDPKVYLALYVLRSSAGA